MQIEAAFRFALKGYNLTAMGNAHRKEYAPFINKP